MIEVTRAETVARPPRSIAWALLTGSSAAVLLTGLVATADVLGMRITSPQPIALAFWPALLCASGLTVAGLGMRALRWIFLLRRAGTRIPIRDAYIGSLAGFSLLLAPLLLGEMYILTARGGVSPATTALVNLRERLLDLLALALIAGVLAAVAGAPVLTIACLAGASATAIGTVRRGVLAALTRLVNRAGSSFNVAANTTNVLFRFYMGYVFLSVNCIDEGVERWLLPGPLSSYTDVPVIDVRYFTFLPEFVPEPVVRLLSSVERRLEWSSWSRYSAHYMAVLRKPA